MTYAAEQRLCKSGEKHLIRKEWRSIMERLGAKPLTTDINHAYEGYELATTAGVLHLFLFHKLKPFTTDLGRFSRIDPKSLPYIMGSFKNVKREGLVFRNISYMGLPAIEAELSQLLNKENVPSATP